MENFKECIQWPLEESWNSPKTSPQAENKAVQVYGAQR